MKFKMAERSLFAVLLRSPWWISFALAGGFALASKALLPPDYVVFGAIGGFPFAVIGVIAAWKQFSAPSTAHVEATLAQIAAMPWRDFSAAAEQAFVREGYEVQRLSSGGADFSLRKSGQTTLLACKRWKAARLGIEAFEELQAARLAQQADSALCISMGELSDKARQYAQQQQIRLMGATELAQMLRPVLAKPART